MKQILLGFLFFMMLSCGTGKTDQVKKDSVKEKSFVENDLKDFFGNISVPMVYLELP